MTQKEFERKVIYKLLDYKSDVFDALKKQFENAVVSKREFTGHGFFTEYDVSDQLKHHNISGEIHDVYAVIGDSVEYGFRLTIEEGKIEALEAFSFEDEWIEKYEMVRLEFARGEERQYTIHYN